MANYVTVITDEGAALLASVIANQGTLTISEMRFSEHDYTGTAQTATAGTFADVFKTASVNSEVTDSTTIKSAASFTNSGITSDHPLYAVGLVGTDGNTTALLCVCTTSDPDYIREPIPISNVSTYGFNINLTVSDTDNITVVGTAALILYSTDVIDNLTSTATDKPLSANMGRVLNEKVESLTNPNLLDNPWFTVNQRGITSATIVNNTYYLDRWLATYATNAGTIEAVSGGVKLTPAVGDYVYIKQRSDIFTSLYGKVITASILLSDGTIKSGTITRTSGTTQGFIDESNIRVRIVSNNDFEVRVDTTTTIRAVKLELGTVSTLHLDVAPNDALELAKCRASTADPSDTYANKGNLVNYADLTSLYLTGSTNSTGTQIDKDTHFYLNGSYCKAKTAILNGDPFTLNTNFEVVTVGGEIKPVVAFKYGTLKSLSATIQTEIENSFTNAADYSMFSGSTSGDTEGGWYGFKHANNKYCHMIFFDRSGIYAITRASDGTYTKNVIFENN